MKTKKRISLLLVMMMLVSAFAGCGKTEVKEESKQTEETKVEESKQTEESKVEEKKEPTVITLASTVAMPTSPIPWYDTEIWQYIQELANVKIEYIEYDEELFNLMLTSGDVPDIVFSNVSAKLDNIIESGLALDMKPYLEEYAPNMASDTYAQRNEIISTYRGGENNALYFIAPRMGVEAPTGGADGSRGYNIRWDYYKEMGAPEITDDEAYIEILEKMAAEHPETEAGEKVYATGLYDSLNTWYYRATFVEPTMSNPWAVSGTQYLATFEDSELFNGYTDTEKGAFWVDMAFYNKLWNKGLLDPDSFTQTSDTYTEKIKAGRYLATTYNRSNDLYNQAKTTDPDTIIGINRIPSSTAQVAFGGKKMLLGDFPTNYMFASAKTENVEAVMSFFNVIHDLDVLRIFYSGFEGRHWNYVDGVPTFTDEMQKSITDYDEMAQELGREYCFKMMPVLGSFLAEDGYPVYLNEMESNRAASLNNVAKDVADYYGVDYPSQLMWQKVEAGEMISLENDCVQLIASCMPAMPTDIARIKEKINDILYRAIPDLVKAKDQAEFDAVQARVLKDLEDAGEPDAWEWVSTEYNKAKDVVMPIFETCPW